MFCLEAWYGAGVGTRPPLGPPWAAPFPLDAILSSLKGRMVQRAHEGLGLLAHRLVTQGMEAQP